ncbi:NrdH-redoxin [Micromonospora sp. NPDC002717]|uniref:NrdH-redoxin n=1 Tax=Micromonospora sp. NPDC002717 TaxID=3154424 RepID=UPI00331D6AFB
MTGESLGHHNGRPVHLVLHGTASCPGAGRSRAMREAAGVTDHYAYLDEDKAATRLVRRLQRRVPTLAQPDGSYLVEPTDKDLRPNLLARQGAPDIPTG